jgi:hypothetical protein
LFLCAGKEIDALYEASCSNKAGVLQPKPLLPFDIRKVRSC